MSFRFIGFNDVVNPTDTRYPPFNIIKNVDGVFTIEVALAGFTQDELDITLNNGQLIITGSPKEQDISYIHHGIGRRGFVRRFNLHEYMKVNEASFSDGILKINVEQVVPEDMKPKKIQINKNTILLG